MYEVVSSQWVEILFKCVFYEQKVAMFLLRKFKKPIGYLNSLLFTVKQKEKQSNIFTVKLQAVDRSTIKFWTFLAKGHST